MSHLGSRKLACSKELGGCALCTKIGIICHYSTQKPMGRPRKLYSTEPSRPTDVLGCSSGGPDYDSQPASFPSSANDASVCKGSLVDVDIDMSQPPIMADTGPGFWDQLNDDVMSYVDILPDDFFHNANSSSISQKDSRHPSIVAGGSAAVHSLHMSLKDTEHDHSSPSQSPTFTSQGSNDSFQQCLMPQEAELMSTPKTREFVLSGSSSRYGVVSNTAAPSLIAKTSCTTCRCATFSSLGSRGWLTISSTMRHVKRDESQPHCKRRQLSGRTCTHLGCAHQTQLTRAAVHRIPSFVSALDSSADYWDLIHFIQQFGQRPNSHMGRPKYIVKFPVEQLSPYIRHLPSRSGYNASLDSAVKCVTAAFRRLFLTLPSERTTSLRHARKLYEKALRRLQSGIEDPKSCIQSETLCAIDLMCIFEVGK